MTFKEAWKKASKKERKDFIMAIIGLASAIMLVLGGIAQFAKYAELIPDDYKYCAGGVFVTSCGFWMMNVVYYIALSKMVDKLKKRTEKLEDMI